MNCKYTLDRALLIGLAAFSVLLNAGNSYAHSGSLNKVAVDVCVNKVKSQACQYEGGHSDLYIGTCQYISDKDLICVRSQPIQQTEEMKVESEDKRDE